MCTQLTPGHFSFCRMGLGKTIQTIGLILSSRPAGVRSYPIKRDMPIIHNAPRCTLIIAPLSVMVNWMQEFNKNAPYVWVAGYSFGAWIGMQLLMRRPEIKRFISVSPPANLYDFSFLAPCPTPGLVIQGGQDSLVPKESVLRLVNRLNLQKSTNITMKVVRAADHSFTDSLKEVYEATKRYTQENMTV